MLDQRTERFLIINADDLGLAEGVNRATLEAFDQGTITSASVMAPCPGVADLLRYLRSRSDLDIGVHITLTSEWPRYRWSPVSDHGTVSSLCDQSGCFLPNAQALEKYANHDELEREIRTQIELVMQSGVRPTHVDTHMGVLLGDLQLRALYRHIVSDYGLPIRYLTSSVKSVSCVSRHLSAPVWRQTYTLALDRAVPGITELIVHPAYGETIRNITGESTPWGARWRQLDFDTVTGAEFGRAIQERGLSLIGWRHAALHLAS